MTFAFVTHGDWLNADVKDNIQIHQEGVGGNNTYHVGMVEGEM